MARKDQSMKATVFLGMTAITVAGVGLYGVVAMIIALSKKGSWPIELVPGGLSFIGLFIAYKAWFKPSARSVRWLCLAAAVVFLSLSIDATESACLRITGMTLLGRQLLANANLTASILWATLGIAPAIVAILLYQLMVYRLVQSLKLQDDRSPAQRLTSIKMSLGVIAVLIFSTGGQISFHTPKPPGKHNSGPDLTEALIFLGPTLLAIGVYKIGVYFAGRRMGDATKSTATDPATPVTNLSR